MKKIRPLVVAMMLSVFGTLLAIAQQPAQQTPPPPMGFFITSTGSGHGANLGGLTGADRICQTRAAAAGSTRTWHAYLSTQATDGKAAVNARDRIGTGPWYNANGDKIASNLADLHSDTLELARLGNNIQKSTGLNEKGGTVNSRDDKPNTHDIMTGSQPEGRAYTDSADHTCSNWTSESATGSAQLGHFDRNGGGNTSWNSTHPSKGCSQENLAGTGGAGLFYCFAVR